jgi:hypothetical protein
MTSGEFTITIIDLYGELPILRITEKRTGNYRNYELSDDQVKLLLRQLALWATR